MKRLPVQPKEIENRLVYLSNNGRKESNYIRPLTKEITIKLEDHAL